MTGVLGFFAGVKGLPPAATAAFNLVAALLTGNGTGGAQNNTFNDNSAGLNSGALVRNGNVAQGAFTPFIQPVGYWGVYFPGDGSRLQVPAGAAFAPGTGDFCIEGFFYNTAASDGQMLYTQTVSGNNYFGLVADASTGRYVFMGPHPTVQYSANGSIRLFRWQHVAVVRISGVVTIYVDGVPSGTPTSNTTNFADTTFLPTVGGYTHTSSYSFTGFISNLRYVKGNGVYTGAFAVPTGPLTATQSAGANINAITGTQTSLLICQNNRFRENSIANVSASWPVTVQGTPQVHQFAPFANSGNPYNVSTMGASAYFDGSGDYVTNNNNQWQYCVGTNNWTWEGFVYPFAYGGSGAGGDLFAVTNVGNGTGGGNANGFHINLGQDINSFRLISNANNGTWQDNLSAGSGNGPPLYAWTHMAVVREGDRISIFKDGTRVATGTGFAGYQFGPTPNNSAGNYGTLVQGGNALKLTNAGTNFGTGNFTAEYAVFLPLGVTDASGLMLETGDNSAGFEIRVNDGAKVTFHTGGSNVLQGGTLTQGAWNHVAVVRSGTQLATFLNGNRVGFNSNYTKDFSSTQLFVIGGRGGGGSTTIMANVRISTNVYYNPASTTYTVPWGGFGAQGGDRQVCCVSSNPLGGSNGNLTVITGSARAIPFGPNARPANNAAANAVVGRFYDGTTVRDFQGHLFNSKFTQNAVYSAAATSITVPTGPFANDGNTLFLMRAENAGIVDSTGRNVWETLGTAQISTAQSKFGGSSLLLPGTVGSYLATVAKRFHDFGTGDFTLEGWFYFNSVAASQGLFGGSGTGCWEVRWVNTDNTLRLGRLNVAFDTSFSWTPVTGRWYHVAVSRVNGIVRAFVDGFGIGSPAANTNVYNASGQVFVGTTDATNNPFNGFIDDWRITDSGLYPSNFVMPGSAFPTS